MAVLQADDYADLVKLTLNKLGKGKWTELATDLQDHVGMNEILRKQRVKEESGKSIDLNVMTSHSGAAQKTGLYATDTVKVGNVMQKGNIPWRHVTTNWALDTRETTMNGGASRIIDIVKTKRADAMISLAELIEEIIWSKPDDDTDNETPFGIPYWVVSNATTGFNGGNPTGFTSGAGGLSSTTYSRWSNYTAQYANVTRGDLIGKMRTGARKISFKSPVSIPHDARNGNSFKRKIYLNEETLQNFENYAEAQNENLGKDVASMDDRTTFRRIELCYAPYLDLDSTNPIYLIDWSVFYIVFLKGEYMKETGPFRAADSHRVLETHIDLTFNTRCTNRRRLAKFNTA